MTAYAFPTRRVLLRDMGKAGLAIMVLGTAACAADDGIEDSPTTDTPTTDGQGSTTTPAVASSTTPGGQVEGHRWERANLGFVSAYVLYRGGEAAVVDTGVADSESVIEGALATAGLDWGSLGHVILTHKHNDHQGSLQAVLDAAPGASWYGGAGDMAAITADRAGRAVGDGDKVFGLEIIETPGHTPGHISVFDAVSGILTVGDSVRGVEGAVSGPNPQFSEDMGQAHESVRKMTGFDYEVILFGHGEPVLSGGTAAMSSFAASLG